jgi:predicted transcriptional regulator
MLKDTLSYAVTEDGEENLGKCVNRLKEWLRELPDRAKVRISIKATVKDEADAEAASKTSDMFKNGEVKDGVQRKGRGLKSAKAKAAEADDVR